MHFITASRGGNDPHIQPVNDAHTNVGYIGSGNYVLSVGDKFKASMINSNTMRILSGDGQINGYRFCIDDFENVTIENGTPGMKRIDLVVVHVEISPSFICRLKVIKGTETSGTPVAPSYTKGDLNNGDAVAEMPLYSVALTDVSVGTPEPLFKVLAPASEFRDSISPLVKVSTLSKSITVNSSNGLNFSIDVPGVEGYSFVGAVGFNSSAWEVCFASLRQNGNSLSCSVFNNASKKLTATISVNALYVAG